MAVCSMLYQLAMRQTEQDRLHEELARVLPTPDTPITAERLDQMHYLRGFIKEVFRSVEIPSSHICHTSSLPYSRHIINPSQLILQA